jgi:tetratricopeptide (TPR) repeat protein
MTQHRRSTVKHSAIAIGVVACGLALAGAAEARNPHCAGGIQYVVQGMRDKDKGNTEDYERQMRKAVEQLSTCAAEDPADAEAIGYLGWAYAETGQWTEAGKAFQQAITGLEAKGDKKKVDWAKGNLESYWVNLYNPAVNDIKTSQEIYPDYLRTPADGEKEMHEQAGRQLDSAIVKLRSARMLKPDDVTTARMLGTSLFLKGEFTEADQVLREALAKKPDDAELKEALTASRTRNASRLLEQEKYDEAIQFYTELSTASPDDATLYAGMGEAYMKRAQKKDGEGRAADWKASGAAYAKAASLRPDDADMQFMAGQGFSNGGDYAGSEKHWREAVRLKPDDVDAIGALAQALTEQKKYDEAVSVVLAGLDKDPRNKALHQRLGGIYSKSGNNDASYKAMVVYLAMQRGAKADKPSAPAGSAAAAALSSQGAPEEVYAWEADGEKYETWLWYGKKSAQTFKGGVSVVKSDWSAPAKATASKK